MRFLLKLGCGLVLLVGLVLGLCFIFFDPLVKGVIEKGGTHATGVATSIASVDVGFVSGSLRLEGLKLENPEGFQKAAFLELGMARSTWKNSSLVSDEIVVEEIEIADVVLLLERANGSTNYGKILENLGRFESSGSKTPEPEPGDASKRKLVVQRIVIRNVKATVLIGDLGGSVGPLSVSVPKIEIVDFHSDGSTVEIVAKLVSTLVQSILEGTLAAGSSTLPQEMRRDLEQNLKSLKGVLGAASKSLKDLKDAVNDVEKLFK